MSRLADSSWMPPVPEDLKAKALEIHHRLCGVFGCPITYFHALDPVSELVSSLLSHRTRNTDSGRAFKALRVRCERSEETSSLTGSSEWK